MGFRRGGEFGYAGKLEVYLPKSAKAEVLNRLVPLVLSGPAFVQVPRKRPGDTLSAGITGDERFVWLKPKVKAAVRIKNGHELDTCVMQSCESSCELFIPPLAVKRYCEFLRGRPLIRTRSCRQNLRC